MKKWIPLFLISGILVSSCSRSDFELPRTNPPVSYPLPVANASVYFRFKLNGHWVQADSVQHSRHAVTRELKLRAWVNSWVLEIPVAHLLQTGNSEQQGVMGTYRIRLSNKETEKEGQVLSKMFRLYSGDPLGDSVVRGRFHFEALLPETGELIRVTDGEFRVRFGESK